MNDAPVKMLFAKTSLAGSLMAFRDIRISIAMSFKRRIGLSIALSLQDSHQFDPRPSAVAHILLPSDCSSLVLMDGWRTSDGMRDEGEGENGDGWQRRLHFEGNQS
jgi:hypothetical protein